MSKSSPRSLMFGPFPTRSAIVVDDDLVDRRLLVRVLNRGHGVTSILTASNLAQARRQVRDSRADLLVLDNALPDGNGIDFAVELAARPRSPLIIIVSDWPTPLMHEKAKMAGVRGIIAKADFFGVRS